MKPLSDDVIARTLEPDVPFDYDDGDDFEYPPQKPVDPRLGPPRALSQSGVCATIASVAHTYRLPVPFFANLIWQESNFGARGISRAGAQGIAQFMPKTAKSYELINPFEPIHALNVSARFLRELHERFGNLGLAAAAYNAGPRRVLDWMARRGALPGETRNYVLRITGRPADQWSGADAVKNPELALMPAKAPCAEVAEAVQQQGKIVRVAKLLTELAQATAPRETAIAAKAGAAGIKLVAAKLERDKMAAVKHKRAEDREAKRSHGKTKVADKTGKGVPDKATKKKVADKAEKKHVSNKSKVVPSRDRGGQRTKVASSR